MNKQFRRKWAGAALALAVVLSGCGTSETSSGNSQAAAGSGEENKLTVYTSVYPLYYVASRIGGDHVEVKNVVPTGVEPHDYEPTAKDVVAMSEADVFVYNGAGLESWIDKALQGFDTSNMTVVNATEGLPLLATEEEEHAHGTEEEDAHGNEESGHGTEEEHGHGEAEHSESATGSEEESAGHSHEPGSADPHVWLDPTLLKRQAERVKEALVTADAAHKDDYEQNFAKLAADLDALDQKFQQMVSQAPRKEFMVSHAAFGYLAHRYGLEQVAISGISPADEPSPQELKELVEHVKEHGMKVILFESLVSPKVAETIAREAGVKTAMLNPLEGLTEAEANAGEDYLSIMHKNLETLRQALYE